MVQLTKKMKQTQKIMQETRKEDTIRLRTKVDELLKNLEIDKKVLLETKQKLINELNKIETLLIKNDGAKLILNKLLENNDGK